MVLKNPKGSDSADFHVKINDKPSAPEGPLRASKVTPESCKLSWEPPKVGVVGGSGLWVVVGYLGGFKCGGVEFSIVLSFVGF